MTIVYKCDACGAESGSTDVTPNETPHIYCSARPEGTWRVPWGVDRAPKADLVDHPPHYTAHPSGVECITITEHMNFNLGNAIKYIWRAGLKDSKNHREDLKKAAWYVAREIRRIDIEAKERAEKTATEKVSEEKLVNTCIEEGCTMQQKCMASRCEFHHAKAYENYPAPADGEVPF